MTPGLFVSGCGMCCAVGFTAPAARAAIRGGLDAFGESQFDDKLGAPIVVAELPLGDVRGPRRLATLFESALSECLSGQPGVDPAETALLLLVAERSRPGYTDRWAAACFQACLSVSKTPFHPESKALPLGRAGLSTALSEAHALLSSSPSAPKSPPIKHVVVAGADTYLSSHTINHLVREERLLSRGGNSDGFIPGEGAGALLLSLATPGRTGLHILGTGTSLVPEEELDELAPRAAALTTAVRGALSDSGCSMDDLDFRMTDLSGEAASFREAAIADTRLLDHRSRPFPVLHLADCIGETGAAVGPLSIAYLAGTMGRGHVPGVSALFHLSNDDGARAAVILRYLFS